MSIGIIASQAFSPNKLSGLRLWLDASDLGTIIESGGDVSQWNDKSSDNNDVTQATGSKQPKTGVDTINGVNAITFDGVDDFLQRITFTGGAITRPDTISIVWELIALPTILDGKIVDGGATGSNRQVIEMDEATDKWQMFAGSFALGSVIPIDTPFITSSLFDGASSEGHINGVLDISVTTGTNNLNGITIGGRFNGVGLLNVKIGELIIHDRAFSTAERLEMQNYLVNKWRVNLSFPLDFSEDFSEDFS